MTSLSETVCSFDIGFPETALGDLRRRLANTRLPEQETVSDFSQGVPLKTIRQVLRYWQTDYAWRKAEARLNAVPNFVTDIDGLDIHFIHVRSKHANALPMIVTHGWPGSIIEQMKIIGPLTDPTAHGGSEQDAFHLVIPSLPGYGFSGHKGYRAQVHADALLKLGPSPIHRLTWGPVKLALMGLDPMLTYADVMQAELSFD